MRWSVLWLLILAIALDNTGLYLVGSTQSSDYHVTPGAYQGSNQGQSDALVLKIVEGP